MSREENEPQWRLQDKRHRFRVQLRQQSKDKMLRTRRMCILSLADSQLARCIKSCFGSVSQQDFERLLLAAEPYSASLVEQLLEQRSILILVTVLMKMQQVFRVPVRAALVRLFSSVVGAMHEDSILEPHRVGLQTALVEQIVCIDADNMDEVKLLVEVVRLLPKLGAYFLFEQMTQRQIIPYKIYAKLESNGCTTQLQQLVKADLGLHVAAFSQIFSRQLAADTIRLLVSHTKEDNEFNLEMCCSTISGLIKACPYDQLNIIAEMLQTSHQPIELIARQSHNDLSEQSKAAILHLLGELAYQLPNFSRLLLARIPVQFHGHCLLSEVGNMAMVTLSYCISTICDCFQQDSQFSKLLTNRLISNLSESADLFSCLMVMEQLIKSSWKGVTEQLLHQGLIQQLARHVHEESAVGLPQVEALLVQVFTSLLEYGKENNLPRIAMILDSHGVTQYLCNQLPDQGEHLHWMHTTLQQNGTMN